MTMKCTQNMVKHVAMKGPCWLEFGPCQLSLQILNHDHYKMLTFNTFLKGVQGGHKKYGTLYSGKNPENKSSHGQMFSGKDFYEPKFLHLLIAKEILMSWISVWTWFSWLAPQQLSYSCSSLGRISLTFLLSLFLQVAVRQEYPLANTQTMLEQAALSFCGLSSLSENAPPRSSSYSPFEILYRRPPPVIKKKKNSK